MLANMQPTSQPEPRSRYWLNSSGGCEHADITAAFNRLGWKEPEDVDLVLLMIGHAGDRHSYYGRLVPPQELETCKTLEANDLMQAPAYAGKDLPIFIKDASHFVSLAKDRPGVVRVHKKSGSWVFDEISFDAFLQGL